MTLAEVPHVAWVITQIVFSLAVFGGIPTAFVFGTAWLLRRLTRGWFIEKTVSDFRRHGVSEEVIERYRQKKMRGDYD